MFGLRLSLRALCSSVEGAVDFSFRQRIKSAPVDAKVLTKIRESGAHRTRHRKIKLKLFDQDRHHTLRHLDFHFVAAAETPSSFLPVDGPEVAFAGRSNCGKSSLLNAVMGKTGLARTSPKPGETQSINFFQSKNSRARLIDLPGYGFAYAKQDKIEKWTEAMHTYLTERKTLKHVIVLVDARMMLKQSDRDLMALLDKNRQSYRVVLTKCDLIDDVELSQRAHVVSTELSDHRGYVPPLHFVAARLGNGVASVCESVSRALSVPFVMPTLHRTTRNPPRQTLSTTRSKPTTAAPKSQPTTGPTRRFGTAATSVKKPRVSPRGAVAKPRKMGGGSKSVGLKKRSAPTSKKSRR